YRRHRHDLQNAGRSGDRCQDPDVLLSIERLPAKQMNSHQPTRRVVMGDRPNQEGGVSRGTFVAVLVAFLLALAVRAWGPWNTADVASNPGPSGTPGSTTVDRTPPPAAGPSGGTTTGAGR